MPYSVYNTGIATCRTNMLPHFGDRLDLRWTKRHQYLILANFTEFYDLLTVHPFTIFCKQNQLCAQIFLIGLLLFSTCFGQICAHHQEKIPYLCDKWHLSLYINDCLVCRADSALHTRQSSIQSDKYQVSHRNGISPNDGHIVARNMQRKAINILRTFVHQVGSINKRLCLQQDKNKGNFVRA